MIFVCVCKLWYLILAHRGLVIAMVVSLLFLLLLRFLAAILVWILIIGVLAVGAFGKRVNDDDDETVRNE